MASSAGGSSVERFGHYELQSLIGRGGMGEVYLAHDGQRNRDVALKLLPEALGAGHEFERRFRREAHAAAQLREPHVIPIHDYGEVDGRLYIDMRLVEGRSLAALLAEGDALAPERAVALVAQVAEALDAAHQSGLVHRDVKPANILVTPSDFVYVADFGLAYTSGQTQSHATKTGVGAGTLDYMAPERFTNGELGPRTDIYSLACVLFECLTAEKPFPGGDLPSQVYAHVYLEPRLPSDIRSAVPADLDAVVARGMAKEPSDRFATAGELARAARNALPVAEPTPPALPTPATPAASPTPAAPPGAPAAPVPTPTPAVERSSERTPRTFGVPVYWLVGTAALVVLAVVLTVLIVSSQRDSAAASGPPAPDPSASQPTAPSPVAPTVAQTANPAAGALARLTPHVPSGMNCHEAQSKVGATAHLDCGSGPFTVSYDVFPEATGATTALAANATAVGATPGACARSGAANSTSYHGSDGVHVAGQLICYEDPTGSHFVYVENDVPGVLTSVAVAGTTDGRSQILAAWKQDTFGPRAQAGAPAGRRGICTSGECEG